VRKLFLLMLLIPVLSWGDCSPTIPEFSTVESSGKQIKVTNEQQELIKKISCEAVRCAEKKDLTPSCICQNLGGLKIIENNNLYCYSSYFNDGSSFGYPMSALLENPITPTPTTPKVSIDDAKKQCEDIGFKPKTEKFGECVLELNR